MKTYDKNLNGSTFRFRLTIGAQREMQKQFNEDAIQTIFAAANDFDKMSYLLGVAANYPGNENPTVNGDEIYDLMVDSGVCGQLDFLREAVMIAGVSGIANQRLRDAVTGSAQRELDKVLTNLEAADDADPT